jgi:hypothetical protein
MRTNNERRKKNKFFRLWLQRVFIVKVGCILLRNLMRKVSMKCMLWVACQMRAWKKVFALEICKENFMVRILCSKLKKHQRVVVYLRECMCRPKNSCKKKKCCRVEWYCINKIARETCYSSGLCYNIELDHNKRWCCGIKWSWRRCLNNNHWWSLLRQW